MPIKISNWSRIPDRESFSHKFEFKEKLMAIQLAKILNPKEHVQLTSNYNNVPPWMSGRKSFQAWGIHIKKPVAQFLILFTKESVEGE